MTDQIEPEFWYDHSDFQFLWTIIKYELYYEYRNAELFPLIAKVRAIVT